MAVASIGQLPKIILQDPQSDRILSHLQWENFPVDRFKATWFLVASSLPSWKDKKNITVTYTSIKGEKAEVFYDAVEYHSALSTGSNAKREQFTGSDRPHGQPSTGVQWNWCGEGVYKDYNCPWRPLGYRLAENAPTDGQPSPEPEWLVTHVDESAGSPGGINIFSRGKAYLPDDLKRDLINAVQEHPSMTISQLGASIYDIVHDEDYCGNLKSEESPAQISGRLVSV